MQRPLFSFEPRHDGVVFVGREHLELVDATHGRIDQGVGRDFVLRSVQPDLAATSGEQPDLVVVVVVGLDAGSDHAVRKMPVTTQCGPFWKHALFPVSLVRVQRTNHVSGGVYNHGVKANDELV